MVITLSELYVFSGSDYYATNATCGEGNAAIHLDDISCPKGAVNLMNCAHNGWGIHDCSHSEDVTLACVPPGKTILNLYLLT